MGLFSSSSRKKEKKEARRAKFREKIDMYDMIVANLLAGKSIIEPDERLDNTQIHIGFSNIASETQISKYFIIRQFPDYVQERLLDVIRERCVTDGVKINYFIYGNPYKINWESAEMRSKMDIWRRFTKENAGDMDVFDYRNKRGDYKATEKIIMSTKYLNEAELDHKRTLIRTAFVIKVSAKRDDESILGMIETIKRLKTLCNMHDIKLRELRVNMIDWVKALGIFSLRSIKEVDGKISRKILTDDILANFNSYKQGRVGHKGVCLGMDVLSNLPVLKKFKANPSAPENWLVSAETGGGKSYFVKSLITELMADGFVVSVMDYEGDEYYNLAGYLAASNPDDVKIVSMGKGSTIYFDPTEIPELTGDKDVDSDLKETSITYILAIFRVIVAGIDSDLTQAESRILSLAIQRLYDSACVTDDPSTWYRSKGLRLSMIYEEVKSMVENKELVDSDDDNVKHKAATRIVEAASIYFEPGEAKAGTFMNPMSANELYKAKFIVFSFGMKGAGNTIADNTLLALRQLSVACIANQVSNYCKYVRKCFNVKVWEEFQRWGKAKGSEEIIVNAMTGGRKRGDVNIVITNDLSNILDENDQVASAIRQNIQNIAVGRVKDSKTRLDFCKTFNLMECKSGLDRIAKAYSTEDGEENRKKTGKSGNKYEYGFFLSLDTGKKSIAKVMLPPSLTNSDIYRTGVYKEGE